MFCCLSGLSNSNSKPLLSLSNMKAAIYQSTSHNNNNDKKTKKLQLILDLDETLIYARHSKHNPFHISQSTVIPQTISIPYVSDDGSRTMCFFDVRIRPGVQHMLHTLKQSYHICLYTLSEKPYAQAIASFLDPKGDIFQGRIISDLGKYGFDNHRRHDSTFVIEKYLSRAQHMFEGGLNIEELIIMDDRADVWNGSTKQLINVPAMKRYCNTSDNVLYSMTNVLKSVAYLHQLYPTWSTPNILMDIKSSVFSGLKFVFGPGILFVNEQGEGSSESNTSQWKLAELFGAICQHEIDNSTTHLLTIHDPALVSSTESVRKAKANHVTIISILWFYQCVAHYQRIPESCFSWPKMLHKLHSIEHVSNIRTTNDIVQDVRRNRGI